MFEIIDNAYAKGYDHIKEQRETGIETPREDYGMTFRSELCQIFAVADGHGDSNCPRSAFGAETACKVAVSTLNDFAREVAKNQMESELIRQGSHGPAQQSMIDKKDRVRLRLLIADIVFKWNDAVNAEYNANPLTPAERVKCDKYIDRYDKGERIEHIYGTTLIAGLLTDKYLLLLQQGDGRCDVFDSQGNVTQPIPWDDKCIANVTTSLCEIDAVQRFRYCVIDVTKNPIVAVIADSDGVEDSFATMDLLHNFHRDLLIHACENGIQELHGYLFNYLPELSENYSRDDVTICGFLDIEKSKALVPFFQKANERVRVESEMRNVSDRLKSMASMGKMDALKELFENACAEVERLETCIDSLNGDIKSRSEELEQAKLSMEKKEQEYRAYQKKKDNLEHELKAVQSELERLEGDSYCAEKEGALDCDD